MSAAISDHQHIAKHVRSLSFLLWWQIGQGEKGVGIDGVTDIDFFGCNTGMERIWQVGVESIG